MVQKTMNDFFVAELQRLYGEEQQLATDLRKLEQAATSPELRSIVRNYTTATKTHADRLERVFSGIGQPPIAKKCPRVDGFSAECESVAALEGDPHVRDVAIIAMGQHFTHDEIAGYGCVRTWAQILGKHEEAKLLQASLDEKKQADVQLTRLAERINKSAVALTI